MSEKVLVVIADEQIRVYHTAGVETAVVVDGEDVQLPDDWTDLPNLVLHSLPITVRADEIFGAPGENPLEHITPLYTGPSVSELILVTNVPTKLLMREPWCPDCDCNHPVGECEGPEPAFESEPCPCCKRQPGEKHAGSCADQNLLVPGGDIVR